MTVTSRRYHLRHQRCVAKSRAIGPSRHTAEPIDEPATKGSAVPVMRSGTQARGRRTGLIVFAVVLGTAAGCGTGSPATDPGGASSSSTSTLPAPWQGTFDSTALPATVQALRAVSCASAQRCWAVGSSVATATVPSGPILMRSNDGGANWTSQTLPPGVGYLAAIACSSTRACTAVGQVGGTGSGPGAILTTTDGGTVWSLQTVPAGTTDVTAVDCPSVSKCLALATVAGRVTALGAPASGATWVPGGPLAPIASTATSIACTDSRHCWATASDTVDPAHAVGSISTTADGGVTWTLQTVPVGTGALNAVTCLAPAAGTSAGQATCTMVGTTSTVENGARTGLGVVLTTTDGGSHWVSAPVPPTVADLFSVTCPSGSCMAVGTTVAASAQGGVALLTSGTGTPATIWRRAVSVPVALPLTSVSCDSPSACVAVGESVSAHLSPT